MKKNSAELTAQLEANQRTSDREIFTLLRKQEPGASDGMTINDD